jgi:hypothetical protein
MDLDVDISLATALLAVEVLVTGLWFGGVAIADLIGARVRARGEASAIVDFVVDYARVTLVALVPAAIVAAGCAGWLAQDAGRTIEDDWWLPASAALWFVAVIGSLARRPLAGRSLAQLSSEHGADAEEVQWRARRVLLLARGELLVLAVAIALQTIKPG